MKILSKGLWEPLDKGRARRIKYRASFWEGGVEAGEQGRGVERDCSDLLIERADGSRRFLNTAPSVSYYSQLMKAAA